ncbi:MAG: hypothetical protein ACI37Z_10430 [Candidatus Gastranaerophilaceae bacterium]
MNIEILSKMSAKDKAKAFDLIVEALSKEPNDISSVNDILHWCEKWCFTD